MLFKCFDYSKSVTGQGSLPKSAVNYFTHALILTPEEGVKWEFENSEVARALFMNDILYRLKPISDDLPDWANSENCSYQIPIGLKVRYKSGEDMILFLPPQFWTWGVFTIPSEKSKIGAKYDQTVSIMHKDRGEVSEATNKDNREFINSLTRTYSVMEWIDIQCKQDGSYDPKPESFKRVSLGNNAVGHRMLCERLEKEGYMFLFESPCFLPGDHELTGNHKRFLDLVVFRNQTALIIEVDGGQHDEFKQRGDDYERDSFIGRHWLKMRRFRNYDCENDLDRVMKVISQLLDTRTNTSSY